MAKLLALGDTTPVVTSPRRSDEPKRPLDVSVVVCAYTEDRWSRTRAAVASLRCQRRAPAEVIVVIDHNPRLLERVRRELADVVVVENQCQRGLSGGRNTAIAVAKHPIVAFLDDDAEAYPEWLERLLLHFDDPRVVGVGGAVRPVWATGRPPWFPHEFDWVVGCTYEGVPSELSAVRNPFGGAMAIRRDVLEAVGGYRCDLGRVGERPLGCEETELCMRISQRRPESVFLFEPAAEILHHVPAERATWRYFRRRCFGEGISKSVVRAATGAGLTTERTYALRTIPRGVWRGLTTARKGDPAGLARAGAILAGLTWTIIGCIWGSVGTGFKGRSNLPPTATMGEVPHRHGT